MRQKRIDFARSLTSNGSHAPATVPATPVAPAVQAAPAARAMPVPQGVQVVQAVAVHHLKNPHIRAGLDEEHYTMFKITFYGY